MVDASKPRATCLVAQYILDVLADEAALDAIQEWSRSNPQQARAFAEHHVGVVTPDA